MPKTITGVFRSVLTPLALALLAFAATGGVCAYLSYGAETTTSDLPELTAIVVGVVMGAMAGVTVFIVVHLLLLALGPLVGLALMRLRPASRA